MQTYRRARGGHARRARTRDGRPRVKGTPRRVRHREHDNLAGARQRQRAGE